MIKNAFIYRLQHSGIFAESANALLAGFEFFPCGPTQPKSIGWVPPREVNGPLMEVISGQWIMKVMTEVKAVPAQTIKEKVDEQALAIEAQTGRKPGKKERRELAEDVKLALLPMAFAKRSATLVWIDPERNLVAVGAPSQTKADDAITLLVKSIEGISLQLIHTNTSPASAMAGWLFTKESPKGFSVDRECELRACDESKAVVKYNRHSLDNDEIADHITHGKMPVKLAMTHDSKTSFVLTNSMQLKKIEFLDVATEEHAHGDADAFDADVTIATSELGKLIDALIEVLGGEVPQQ